MILLKATLLEKKDIFTIKDENNNYYINKKLLINEQVKIINKLIKRERSERIKDITERLLNPFLFFFFIDLVPVDCKSFFNPLKKSFSSS